MEVVKKGEVKFALKFCAAEDIKDGLNFFSYENDYLQIGGWRYSNGKVLQEHNHNQVKRSIDRTQEFIFVVSGSVEARIYDEEDNLLKKFVLKKNDGLILFAGGHGYTILSDDTLVLELKNGPYPGPDKDRRRF